MKQILFFIAVSCLTFALNAQNQAPQIANFTASINWQSATLTLQYDLWDAENDPCDVLVEISKDGGKSYDLTNLVTASGDLGFPINPSLNKSIQIDVSALSNFSGTQFTVRIVVDDQQPFDLDALVAQVDSNRLRDDLAFLEGIRHRTGNAVHLQETRDSLKQFFTDLGLPLYLEAVPLGNYTGQNIWGELVGSVTPEEIAVVDAHYDTVINAPGADDNGSGVVGVMEIARILSQYPCKKSLRFASYDLEESGIVGSKRHVANASAAGENILGVLNFEMIGFYSEEPGSQTLPAGFNLLFPDVYAEVQGNEFRGDFISNVGNTNSSDLSAMYEAAAVNYVPELQVITMNVPGTGTLAPDLRRSDHAAFWDGGYKALMLTDGANFRNECYHTPQDTFENKLNFGFMANVVKASLVTLAELGELQHGDWATATFQGTSRTFENDPCTVWVRDVLVSQEQMVVNVGPCYLNWLNLELFDSKGALVFSHNIDPLMEGEHLVLLPKLPAGIYMMKFATQNKTWTQKVFFR